MITLADLELMRYNLTNSIEETQSLIQKEIYIPDKLEYVNQLVVFINQYKVIQHQLLYYENINKSYDDFNVVITEV